MSILKKILTAFCMAAILLGVVGCGGYDADVLKVREGHMNNRPDVPIGKAFDQFFDKGSWESFTSTENEKIVEFNGDSKIFDETVKAKIQFRLTGETFNLNYVGLDGESMPDAAAVIFVDGILDSYKTK